MLTDVELKIIDNEYEKHKHDGLVYYNDELVTIYNGDCRDILSVLPDKSIDLILTDPPFFMPAVHYQSRVNWQRTWGDTSILATFWDVILEKSIPKLKETGHFITFCNHESYPVFYPCMYRYFDYMKSIVWDKKKVGLGRTWRNQHELIIAARWHKAIFNNDGKLRADVLSYEATRSQNREHPVEKPTPLLADLIEPTTHKGGIVLDLFMGSGTTLLAAKNLGRKAIGIEIDKHYCEVSSQRMRQLL
jgi:site-specific DNA-methyltransferase (adenine-specific)